MLNGIILPSNKVIWLQLCILVETETLLNQVSCVKCCTHFIFSNATGFRQSLKVFESLEKWSAIFKVSKVCYEQLTEVSESWWILTLPVKMQWCTFPSVSGHRPIKIPKEQMFKQPSVGPIKNTILVVSCPIIFTMLWTSLLLFSYQIQALDQCKTDMLTSASGLQGHHVWLK